MNLRKLDNQTGSNLRVKIELSKEPKVWKITQ